MNTKRRWVMMTPETIARVAGVTVAEARMRLEEMADDGYLMRLGTMDGEMAYGPAEKGECEAAKHVNARRTV
jgi:uncharacterized protein (UPF0128 family)